jgi:hypothetical protein
MTNWPTPSADFLSGDDPELFRARAARLKEKHAGRTGNGAGMTLATAANGWPTPTANDWKGSGPTLERKDGQMRGDRLDYAAEQLWSTPRSSDGEKGGPNQSFGAGGTPLPAQASQWPTPRVTTNGGSGNGARADQSRLEDTASAFSLPDRPISTSGDASSHIRRTLNPLFVEWLMGWPPGWTSLALTPPASSVCACSETALSAWKARMRSALSQLALPAEAPPAQLALFG